MIMASDRWSSLLLNLCVLFFSLLGPAIGIAQDRSDDRLIASPARMNILYEEVDNPVEVAVPGMKCEDLEVVVSQGTIQGEGCSYMIRPDRNSKTLTLEARWSEHGERRKATRLFRVKEVPLPEPYVAGRSVLDDTLRLKEATATQGVILRLTDFPFDVKIMVVGFRLQVLRECDPVFDGVSDAAPFTDPMKNALAGVQQGDVVRITEIHGRFPDGHEVVVSPLHFVIH